MGHHAVIGFKNPPTKGVTTNGAFLETEDPAEATEHQEEATTELALNLSVPVLVSSLTRQCLKGRRLGDIELLRTETQAWHQASNKKQRGVDWQFKIDDARHKLKSLYPKILV